VVVSAITDVMDKVILLELGADDYVTKPFSPRELLARVRRAIRRWGPKPTDLTNLAIRPIQHERVAFDDVRIDLTGLEATRAGKLLTLAPKKFGLLKVFSRSPARAFLREELLNEICEYKHNQGHPSTRVVDNCVLRFRQKLEPDPGRPRYFLTMHGLGYKSSLPAREEERGRDP
jgi:DNA-binding response OmpR family regulator